MKLTKETLKRIIKEEMMQVMHEMDSEQTNDLPEPLKELQRRLEGVEGLTIEQDEKTLSIETDTNEWTASVDPAGDLILDFDNSNSEQIVGIEKAVDYLLTL